MSNRGSIVVLVIVALFISAFFLAMTNTGPDPAEQQYYRAHYDVCRFVLEQPRGACLDLVRELRDAGVYEQPSPGWAWPPAAAAGDDL